ncbi:S9 family peptidase [Xanthomonas rydalmerensis]|uniref:S9 family peptidase n=1 Tax=Xanthomonas rydalmerensis TaxID=3046274 RepID=A0ABZ0JI40_9XANT|nr:S9 family peptidase [Xanthomonas sp. DM-2023]WOS39437.1 S9 family peptidase [Xanthomonas sp. DM-2023]WOS43621.1 S9 family peptidase [Xanthomonas sp. DM-2023]WOS47802.1 S9 family peptidase [Xanthomonas sp. DM-2023]WOS51980.1 S9 family peptidase [Xanthomonas sp. DM-2023]WOS56164.1 S9 family peptidase [Xanthomonas sp. DM-2023]
MKRGLRAVALLCLLGAGNAWAQVDLAPYLKKEQVGELKLSPTGEYYAATVPLADRTALAVMRRSDSKIVGSFSMDKNSHVNEFEWVNDTRVVFSMAEKIGSLDAPRGTGELFAINADGSAAELLVGQRVTGNGPGTLIQTKKVEDVIADMVGPLPGDDRNVIIQVRPFSVSKDPYSRAEIMDVYTGRRRTLAGSPKVRGAEFYSDEQGKVRFASGADADNARKLFYRDPQGSDWKLINDENVSQHVETPLGFSEDGRIAYLQVQQAKGSDAIESWNADSGERKVVAHDALADPYRIMYRHGTRVPVGVEVLGDKPRSLFFDANSPEAKTQRSLEAAFPGQAVYVTSSTRDGRLNLVQVQSGRNPGEFYLFDTVAKKAEFVFARRAALQPPKLGEVRPIALQARDGLTLHGFVTLPTSAATGKVPMVVMPHGGPFGIFDNGLFDEDAQLLASAGYAVLQVNYRGSGNYGRSFKQAGAGQWGGKMQDDVTDATRWAIAQGIADPQRICMFGASYGAYASLMGVAKEPSLYRCAAGYVGVYDLPLMYAKGDIQQRDAGQTYLREWLGPSSELAAVSPVNLADRIKVPVFLAAGGEDERAPILHSKKMEVALKKAGVPVETLYVPTEGHGFYTEEHRREFYTRLLAFLSKSLGGAQAAPAATKP